MFISNTIKMAGCIAMLIASTADRLWLAGFGAAAYSPAKYGISPNTSLRKDWCGNSWMEGLTVPPSSSGRNRCMLIHTEFRTTIMTNLMFRPSSPRGIGHLHHLLHLSPGSIDQSLIPVVPIDHKALSSKSLLLLKDFAPLLHVAVERPAGSGFTRCHHTFLGAGATLRLLVLSWAAVACITVSVNGQAYRLGRRGIAIGAVWPHV